MEDDIKRRLPLVMPKLQPREFPRNESKAKEVNEKRKRERKKVSNNNGQIRIANATSRVAHASRLGQFRNQCTVLTDLNINSTILYHDLE